MASTVRATSDELPFHLRGNFAPVQDEVTALDLRVEGAIPPELSGRYLRNGPNPKSGASEHWFFGDGMVHGVRLEKGRAAWYRNRWVRTRALEEGVSFVSADGTVDHTIAVANTNIICHAKRFLALVESSFPTEISADLETVGICDFGGKLQTAMTAHPKLCPKTGELHFFGYGFLPPWLVYHRLDASGKLVQSEVIEVPGPTMMHDFAITERHVVFMDLPIVFDLERAMSGGGMPYLWSDTYGARLGVMPRGGTNADMRWFEIEPCYVFHPLNAFDDGERIVVDVARYPELWRGGSDSIASAHLHRWTVDLARGSVGEQPLDDRVIEFPRVDERRVGQPHRYGYVAADAITAAEQPARLVKYDLRTGAAQDHVFGPACVPSEPVFIPALERAGEDEGYVVCFVYDGTRDGSDFVILDATRFDKAPLATVRLPQRVPFGFHGNWVGDW
jgi:carotenoid cleavage dioxygenase-like enzyme